MPGAHRTDEEDHGTFVPVGLVNFPRTKQSALFMMRVPNLVQRKGLTPEVQPFQIFS